MAIKLKLTQGAYPGSGDEYRLHTETGKPSICVLHDWYEAHAVDADGNDYMVYWKTNADWRARQNDPDSADYGDESDACDWNNPDEIMCLDTGANVTEQAEIEW